MKGTYLITGIMSGTSMDGTDLACCRFTKNASGGWDYEIIAAETVPYSEMWRVRLSQLPQQSAENYRKTDVFYGRYLGKLAHDFHAKHKIQPDFIASHGHTIFHRPEQGFSAQVGEGASIYAYAGIPVVADFRSTDLALGGQGAPLVPIGDALLFAEYDACLNLGGISNISLSSEKGRIAFDISPCNIVLNRVARWLGLPYDPEGSIAASADPIDEMVNALNDLPYYSKSGAKSLGREWINEHFWPIVKQFPDLSEAEKMASLNLHIATQIANVIHEAKVGKVLITGGGAFNKTLIAHLKQLCSATLHVPSSDLVNYKEALVFAFLGLLRVNNQHNVLSIVTGSKFNHIAGALYGDFNSLNN